MILIDIIYFKHSLTYCLIVMYLPVKPELNLGLIVFENAACLTISIVHEMCEVRKQ